jgi:hypothetical protein
LVEGIYFGEIFFLVSKLTSIIFMLSVVVAFYFEVEQMDVKSTFLHGDLEEEIYMKQPKGFAVKGKKEPVCKLKNSLYGLKQSPRMWYKKFDTYMLGFGFTRSKEDHCVYFKLIGDHLIYLVLYVDDMVLIGNKKETIRDVETQLSSKFYMKDLDASNFILGMECWLWSLIIFLIQRSLLSTMFIPHEVFTPQKYVHSSTWGSAEGGRGFGGEAPEGKIAL